MALHEGDVAVDGTAGGGGHTVRIAQAVGSTGRVFALDRDQSMLERARAKSEASDLVDRISFQHHSYVELADVLRDAACPLADAILVDLGLSSDQLADRERGFGFQVGGPLDLRFDSTRGIPASEWLTATSDHEVRAALRDFGDISESDPVSKAIVASRRNLRTTDQLASLVLDAAGGRGKTHPATVVLQALRIVVNDELEHVRRAVEEVFPACLKPGGRLVVLTFHSIEDRCVKQGLKRKEVWTYQQKKPILPRPAEVRDNPRSRSAKLRVAIRAS